MTAEDEARADFERWNDAMLRTRLARAEEAARTNAAEADAALKSLKKAERKLRRVENTKAYVQIKGRNRSRREGRAGA